MVLAAAVVPPALVASVLWSGEAGTTRFRLAALAAGLVLGLLAGATAGNTLLLAPLAAFARAFRHFAAPEEDRLLPALPIELDRVVATLHALRAAGRVEAQHAAASQRELHQATARAQALASVSILLAGADASVDGLAHTVVQLMTDLVGDGANLRLLGEGRSLKAGYSAHRTADQAVLLAEAAAHPYVLDTEMLTRLTTGGISVTNSDPSALFEQASGPSKAPYRAMKVDAVAVLPLRARGRLVGALALFRSGPGRGFSEADILFAEELASRAALALLNAQLLQSVTAEVEQRRSAQKRMGVALTRQHELVLRIDEIGSLERRRVAADMHDDVVQVLTAAQMRLGGARLSASGALDDQLEATESVLSAAIGRLRSMLFELAPPDLTRLGLERALLRLATDTFAGTPTEVHVDVALRELAAPGSEAVFRITREALRNARQHAGAEHVTVRVRARRRGLLCQVFDDGCGTTVEQRVSVPGHLGMTSMAERAEAAGGWLTWAVEGPGTHLEFWIPRQASTAA